MQKGHLLQFNCQSCQQSIHFSIFELDNRETPICCQSCEKKYAFDETLKRQLKKFAGLCHQLVESEEILSQTSIAIDVCSHHVKVPFKLLLTRLNSTLDLIVGNEPLAITFRLEPLKDLPAKSS